MTPEALRELANAWLSDVRVEAQKLFGEGVPPEQCLKLAIAINDAKAIGRVQRAMAQPSGLVVPGRH